MTSKMTPESAASLRKPFPPESVGKLPKGGTLLDYVGHAAVTDRLLTVDPEWSWEPFALGPNGLPAVDQAGNLWIRLTVLGVTRIGVGDGKSAKECIGDAIRNAAMRFGVALDLWAKENLVEFEQAVRSHRASAGAVADAAARTTAALKPPTGAGYETGEVTPKLTPKQQGLLFAKFHDKGIPEPEQASGMAAILRRTVEHRTAITRAELDAVLARLDELPDAQVEATE